MNSQLTSFYCCTPNNKLTVYGFNSALEITSNTNNNFTSLTDNYNHWKRNWKNNWDEKNILSKFILCCSAKFDTISPTEEWIDFEPLRIYIPEFLFAFQNDEVSGCYNFVIDSQSNIEILSSNLLSFLKRFSDNY